MRKRAFFQPLLHLAAACTPGGAEAVAPLPAPNSNQRPSFSLTPDTRICVWVVVDDNIRGINHVALSDKVISSNFAGRIARNFPGRMSNPNRVIRMIAEVPPTLIRQCRPEANPIYVRVHYSLNAAGNPLKVSWVVWQGAVIVRRVAERDSERERAAGIYFESNTTRSESMLTDDLAKRAKEIAAVIEEV